ncbi:MAG: glycosyltransferase 87 family protein [Gaiellaceae bacterium]
MLFLPAFALVAVAAFAVAFRLRLSWPGTLLAAYLVGSAEVVLGAEVLSPFHAIGVWGYLVWEVPLAFAAVAVWSRAGRPRPPLPRVGFGALKRHPLLVVLGLVVGAALVFELVLATTTVPNSWDGMTYHLSRAAGWYQHGSLAWLNAHTPRENIFPPNAEIQTLYTMVFTHGDHLAGLPQYLAELALLVGIFGVARRLGFARSNAAFAALLFATLSEVALQSTTPQNDLVVGAYLLAAVYFVLGRTRSEVALASLALGLAIGTKLTAFYALPIVALLALSLLPRRRIVELVAGTAVACAAVAALVYVENVVHTGSPLGPAAVRQPFAPVVTPSGTVSTTSRILYRFIDFSGYQADIRLRVTLQNSGIFVFDKLGIAAEPLASTQTPFFFLPNVRANEDISYFGPLGALLFLPLLAGYLLAWLARRTTRVHAILAVTVPLFALELALTYRYNEWLGRFMIVPVALCAALVARVYTMRVVSAFFAVCGIVFLSFALLQNERKPIGLAGTKPVWSLSRADAQGLAWPGFAPTFAGIDSVVPQNARVGILLGDEDWDYPLYGAHLTRRLIPLPAADPLGAAHKLGLQWVVVGNVRTTERPGWSGVRFPNTQWDLVAPKGSDAAKRIADYERTATAQSERPKGSLSASSARNTGTKRS